MSLRKGVASVEVAHQQCPFHFLDRKHSLNVLARTPALPVLMEIRIIERVSLVLAQLLLDPFVL